MKTVLNPNGIIATIRENYGWTADADSYKLTHIPQYVKGAKRMVSYIESRGGKFDKLVWFGLQLINKEFLLQKLTHKMVDNIIAFEQVHFMGNCTDDLEVALRTVVDEYDGKLPIRIRAAEEGLLIPVKHVLASVESIVDDERVFSLVSYVETKLMRVWSPSTVATFSWHVRQYIYDQLVKTADDPDAEIDFKLHDFGARGTSAYETSCFAGAGHLLSFKGSDTVSAVLAANIGYHDQMAAFSIPASEHSTTTMHGRDGEEQMVTQMFDAYAKPGAIFATVIDSFDWTKFIADIAPKFKERLINSGATWVFRPDSGHPVKTPVEAVKRLDAVFGHKVNTKGYKVLNNVRVIQGDGIGYDEVIGICELLIKNGYSVSNMAFGMGGGLLQKNNRDTMKFAMKCCAVLIGDEWVDVYKDPAIYDADTWEVITGDEANFKTSKRGRIELVRNVKTNEYRTLRLEEALDLVKDEDWVMALETVYESGEIVKDLTFAQVRENLSQYGN